MDEEAGEGVRVGFEEVFEAEHEVMVRLAYLLLGSQALAEEAVQDAFARLLDRYDAIGNPGGWVRTATINRCHDLLRRRTRERRILGRLRPRAHVEQPGEHLDDVLDGLSPRRREVVVLRFYAGLTTSEIATELDIPEGTVRSTMHRALRDMRGALS